jgi:hypothetical protein
MHIFLSSNDDRRVTGRRFRRLRLEIAREALCDLFVYTF